MSVLPGDLTGPGDPGRALPRDPGPVLPGDPGPVLPAYRSRIGRVDELLGPDGGPRPGRDELAAGIELLGLEGLLARRAQARGLVEDDGVTYGLPGAAGQAGPPRRWAVDPLPVVIEPAEWGRLEAGLIQRAELLDLMLADLYGPRRLLGRLLPAPVVLAHDGFLRAADQVRLPGPRQLPLLATDLGRGTDGGWQVLADRTQAPSGAGYAMENRRIVSRVMPGLYRDLRPSRLRTFFHAVRGAVQEAAPRPAGSGSGSDSGPGSGSGSDSGPGAGPEQPRVVLLTPGPGGETAFDQAFLATLLGYPMVEGRDLTVRDGRLWMRSLGGLEPVHVLLRRVDAWFCDPLELRPDSRLGAPGLVEAARLGNVSVLNPLGAGVLENPGLLAFLPGLARALLGQDLALPGVTTWWCGDPLHRAHVLARLDRLVLRPLARGAGRGSRFGWELSAQQRDQLRRRIEAAPDAWCGQEPLELSTAPVVTSAGLQPRRMVLRTFAVGSAAGYRLMAGGLARVAASADTLVVSNQAGALAKDVWVPLAEPAGPEPIVLPAAGPRPAEPALEPVPEPAMASRVAEDLFWLGRYAERAEDTARLLRVTDDLAEDYARRTGSAGAAALGVLTAALSAATGLHLPAGPGPAEPQRSLLALAVDADRPGTLAFAVRRTVEAAHAVREQLSVDTWLVLGSLDRLLAELAAAGPPAEPGPAELGPAELGPAELGPAELGPAELGPAELGTAESSAVELPALQPTLARVLEGMLALAGLGAESMVRDAGWAFLDAGRRLERGLQLVLLLRNTLHRVRPPEVDAQVLESMLHAAESIITYRRRQAAGALPAGPPAAQLAGVLHLLLLDRANPRALRYQLDRLAADLDELPDRPRTGGLRGRLRDLLARLREADLLALAVPGPGGFREPLGELLDALEVDLRGLATAIEQAHFAQLAPPQPLPAGSGWGAS